jgi:hypothetical protein
MIVASKYHFLLKISVLSFLLFFIAACHRHGAGYNPYLHSKPTVKQQRENAKALEEGSRSYRKQMRKTRRRMYGGSPAPSKPSN